MVHFKHFIITQFNIRLWDKDKRNISTYTEEWLNKRFTLFDLYCFPSVSQQTNPNFIWICLFDKETPDLYKNKIKEYQKQCPQLQAYFLDEDDTREWLGYTKDIMSQYIETQDQYIVSTNLDNDDAIHINMIDNVSKHINEKPEAVVYSFNYGYQYFTESGLILKMLYPHNHFLSFVEENTPNFQTIKFAPHAKIRKLFKTVDIKTEPYWIEFVHNNNVNNDLRITSRIKYYFVLKELSLTNFGLNIVLKRKQNIMTSITKFPIMFATTAIRKLKKKVGKKSA